MRCFQSKQSDEKAADQEEPKGNESRVSRQISLPKAPSIATSPSDLNLVGTGPKGFFAFMDQEVPMMYEPIEIVFHAESPVHPRKDLQSSSKI